MKIGIDSGGTFTDFAVYDASGVSVFKIPSNNAAPHETLADGVRQTYAQRTNSTARAKIVHGTTIATNLTLEQKLAPTVLVATAGFKDFMEIGRQNRCNLYDLSAQKPPALVPEHLRIELQERILADGTVRLRPSQKSLQELRTAIEKLQPAAIAVCLLHAYRNPEHEELVKEVLAGGPWHISLSSEVWPVFREYERGVLTVLNAGIAPLMTAYLANIRAHEAQADVYVMQSNGGCSGIQSASEHPISTILSGPSAGVTAALALAKNLGVDNAITFDMGGTSTDVSLIHKGRLTYTDETTLLGLPVAKSMLNIKVVGAGGGSILHWEAADSLQIGPHSVGAIPGPVAYGHGSQLSITDANLLLGRILPQYFFGGALQLDSAKVADTFAAFASHKGMQALDIAEGAVAIVNAQMARAIQQVSAEKGRDPQEFSLIAYGGGSGLHAVDVAAHLGIQQVIFPYRGAVFSALGLLMAPVLVDRAKTVLVNPLRVSFESLERLAVGLEEEIRSELSRNSALTNSLSSLSWERLCSVQYVGQSSAIELPLTPLYIDDFHYEHKQRFGFHFPDKRVELVNIRVVGLIPQNGDDLLSDFIPPAEGEALLGMQNLYIQGTWRSCSIYLREKLAIDSVTFGPCLLIENDTTIFVPSGYGAKRLAAGHLLVEAQ